MLFICNALNRLFLKGDSNTKKLSQNQVLQDSGVNDNAAQIIWTLLFQGPKEMSEINNLRDAIRHSRTGTGAAVPSGPGLLNEMKSDNTYQEYIKPDGELFKKVQSEISKATPSQEPSTITFSYGSSVSFNSQTLGGYCPSMYNVSVTYTNSDGKTNANVNFQFSGKDSWDFVSNASFGWLKNLIREKIPEFFVRLRGEFKAFDITYVLTDEIHYEF